MNKKLIGLVLLVSLATTLGACNSGDSAPGSSPAASPTTSPS